MVPEEHDQLEAQNIPGKGIVTTRAEELANLYFVGYWASISVVWGSGQDPSRAGLQTRDQAVL